MSATSVLWFLICGVLLASPAAALSLSDCDEQEPAYPCYVQTEKGAVPVAEAWQTPGPGAAHDGDAPGIVNWRAGDPELVFRRFSKAALEAAEVMIPDAYLMEQVEIVNAKHGAPTARKLLELVAEMELMDATETQIQFAVRDFAADPDDGTADSILERLAIDTFDLPEGLFDRGWSAADLVQTLVDFRNLGGTVPREQMTAKFFNAYQAALRGDDSEAFVKEWVGRFTPPVAAEE